MIKIIEKNLHIHSLQSWSLTDKKKKTSFLCASMLDVPEWKSYLQYRNSLSVTYKFCQNNWWCNSNLSHLIKSHTGKNEIIIIILDFKTGKLSVANRSIKSHLLYFKLTLARPVENDITNPRVNKDKRPDFAGGDAGRRAKAFRTAIKAQLTA